MTMAGTGTGTGLPGAAVGVPADGARRAGGGRLRCARSGRGGGDRAGGAASRLVRAAGRPARGRQRPRGRRRGARCAARAAAGQPRASTRRPACGRPATTGPAVRGSRRRGQLVVGVDQNSYLWGYRDPATGDWRASTSTSCRPIAQDILGDRPPRSVQGGADRRADPGAAPAAQVDMVVRTMTINCARKRQVAFSTAYFEAGQQVLVPEGLADHGFDDSLRGKRVCTADGFDRARASCARQRPRRPDA